MATIRFDQLAVLPAFDNNKILAVENDPHGAGGWKAHVSTDGTFAAASAAKLVTQLAIKIYVDNAILNDPNRPTIDEKNAMDGANAPSATNVFATADDLESVSVLYSNATPTPEDLGGIPAGSTFSNDTMTQMWDALLYPYGTPTFASFSISGQASPLEVGAQISGAKTFVWSTTNGGNVSPNSIDIIDVTGGNITLLSSLANDGSQGYTFPTPIEVDTASSYTWKIQGVDTESGAFIRNYSVDWNWRKFWGTSANTSLTAGQIQALANSQLSTTAPTTYSFASSNYKYFAWPTSFTQPTSFKDASTGLIVAMNTPYTINITNTNGITTNYTVYRTLNMIGGSISIIVT